METFYRHTYSELVITLRADSSLGLLGGGYLEDYFGTDNQLTIHNISAGTRIPILVEEDTEITPSTPHDVFVAVIDLDSVPDGLYRIEGRARDEAGNFTILSDFSSPNGTEDFIMMEILISPLGIVVFAPKVAEISLADAPEFEFILTATPAAILQLQSATYDISIQLSPEITATFSLPDDMETQFQLADEKIMQVLDVYTL